MFRTLTESDTAKSRIFTRLRSWWSFCLACCAFTCFSTLGSKLLNLIWGWRFRKSSAGGTPVTVCGVFLFRNKKFASLCSIVNLGWPSWCDATCFRSACFRICTERSAAPFDAGWYGGVRVCLIPFIFMKFVKSCDTNWGPLSDTTSSGSPYELNRSRSTAIVLCEVVEVMCFTSNHFEWLSMTTKKLLPSFSAKSICSLCHTRFGQVHGCNGATGGLVCTVWHILQLCACASMSSFSRGHHI